MDKTELKEIRNFIKTYCLKDNDKVKGFHQCCLKKNHKGKWKEFVPKEGE